MVINTDNLVSITEANQNFSRVARMVDENGAAVIAGIAPRRNVFVRPPMANLDVLFLVASTTQPTPSTLVLDKLSAIAVDKGVQPVVVCTKSDKLNRGETEAQTALFNQLFQEQGIDWLPFSSVKGSGLEALKQVIESAVDQEGMGD